MTTYTTWLSQLESLAVDTGSADFLNVVPAAIDYAEQRMYRELDLLSNIVRDSSANATANTRTFTLPQAQGRFVVLQSVNVVTPVGATVSNGTRNPLVRASRDWLDFTWPSETAANASTVPIYWAPITDQIILLGPPPGAGFNVEAIGTIRPTPLSATNTSTFLTNFLPDLFLAATMVFISGYQKNFGAQADDPKMAQSWENQYQTLFHSASTEEVRKRVAVA